MLGVFVFVFSVVALFAGLEFGSPGVLKAIVHAVVSLNHAASTHVGLQICDQLQRLGDQAAVCQPLH